VKIWLDAQLSPRVAAWIEGAIGGLEAVVAVQADPERRCWLDSEIFEGAREAQAVVMTKDRDFVDLLERLGPPPQVIWLTCGNTSNDSLQRLLAVALPAALRLLESGEPLVEITDLEGV
jgi:predicted nuclease of predicted toxin-antitoxin system